MKIRPPQLVTSPTAISTFTAADNVSIDGVIITNLDAQDAAARSMHFDQVVLRKAILSSAQLDKLNLLDCTLEQCDLSATECSRASWTRVRCAGGRLTGLDLSQSTLNDVVFDGCKLDMSNFRSAKLSRVQFVDCIMTEVDFQDAILVDVEFQSCELEKTDFTHAKLTHVDARTSQLFDLRGWQSLKGLTIDPIQLTGLAPELAHALGVIVKD